MRAFTKELLTTKTMHRGWKYKQNYLGQVLVSVAYGNGIFMAVGKNGKVFISSDNGTSWDRTTVGKKGLLPSSYNDWYDVEYYYHPNSGLHYFYLVGSSGYYTYTTDNGLTWATTTKLVENSSDSYYAVAVSSANSYGDIKQYYVGENGNIYKSNSGLTTSGVVDWQDCMFCDNLGVSFIAVGYGTYNKGTNSRTWINSTIGEHTTPHVRKVNDKFIVTAKEYGLHVSTELYTFTNNTTCPVSPIDIAYLNGLYIVAGVSGVAWSPDLSYWETMSWDSLGLDSTEPTSMAVSNSAIVITKGEYRVVKQLA